MTEKNKYDSIYADLRENIDRFVFDDQVASVFNDMIHRSVPGYDAVIAMIGVLAERYVRSGTQCFDLGASLGAVTLSIHNSLQGRDCQIVAVDNSQAMAERLGNIVKEKDLSDSISIRQEDIRNTLIENASLVVLNFTLQFIEPEERAKVIQNIYDGLLPGGIFVISEKITFNDEKEDAFQIDMHHEFKKLHGYSNLEISQKRSALENVLIPDTEEIHLARLQQSGFQQSYTWFQCFNFISIVAVK